MQISKNAKFIIVPMLVLVLTSAFAFSNETSPMEMNHPTVFSSDSGTDAFPGNHTFENPTLSDVVKALQTLVGINANLENSPVDSNRNGRVEINDAIENLLKMAAYGGETGYAINSAARVEIADAISGAFIIFPEGGQGDLSVKDIQSGPDVNGLDGNLFLLEYTGDGPIQLSYPRTGDEEPLVWVYGIPKDPIDFSIETAGQWLPLLPQDTVTDLAIFDLYNPGEAIETAAEAAPNVRSPLKRPDHSYFVYYRNALKYNDWAWKRIEVLWDITQKTIADIWNVLPAAVQAQKLNDYNSDLKPKGAYSGWSSGYIGFRYLAGLIRTRNPHFWYGVYNNSADEAVAAHESGHYISHLILGDEQFEKLQAQRTNPHDLGDVHTNRNMLEEYAFFGDYFKNGDLLYNKWDIVNATQFFKWKRSEKDGINDNDVSPQNYNWPNLEGFGCYFLARLHTDKNELVSHPDINQNEPVPVFELDFTTIYGFLARGPLTVNELYDYVEDTLNGDDKAKLAVMVEKMGWAYNGFGKIVDTDGKEVAGAMVENVSSYSAWQTFRNPGSLHTGSDGMFHIDRIYPEKSKLRVHYNYQNGQYLNVKDFEITVPKEEPTNVPIDFGTLVVDKVDPFNFSTVKVFIQLDNPAFYYNDLRYYGYELCGYADHNDVGSVNFPSEQGKRFRGSIEDNVFTGTCTSSLLGPGEGQITIRLSENREVIEYFNLTFSNGYSDMYNFIIISASASGGGSYPIPRTFFMPDYQAEFKITGNSHNYLSNLNYLIQCKNYLPERTYDLSYSQSTQDFLLIRFED